MTAPDCTAFQLRLLALLDRRDDAPKGVTIKQRLEAYLGEQLNHGRLYQNLDHLVEAGYVEKRPRDGRTNAYSITDAGHETLMTELAWLRGEHTPEAQ